MISVKLIDDLLTHQRGISIRGPSKFQWTRGEPSNEDIVFFTDTCLSKAINSQGAKKIAVLMEPPDIHQQYYDEALNLMDLFDYVLTYSRNILDEFPQKALFYCPSTTWIEEELIQVHPKNKLLSIIASVKDYLPNQALRQQIINIFGNKMDVFGRGRKEIGSKYSGLGQYMFSIAVESSTYDDYFTEKIIDCIAVGTIPIYHGTQNIGQYFNPDGIITFEDIKDLEVIINEMISAQFYIDRIKAVHENLQIVKSLYYSADDFIFDKYPFIFSK